MSWLCRTVFISEAYLWCHASVKVACAAIHKLDGLAIDTKLAKNVPSWYWIFYPTSKYVKIYKVLNLYSGNVMYHQNSVGSPWACNLSLNIIATFLSFTLIITCYSDRSITQHVYLYPPFLAWTASLTLLPKSNHISERKHKKCET